MSRPSVVVLAWAGMLAALGVLLLVWTTSALVVGLLLGCAAAVALLAALVHLARAPERRTVPDISLATLVSALGLALVVAGGAFGFWLVLIGAGVTVAGLAGVVAERS